MRFRIPHVFGRAPRVSCYAKPMAVDGRGAADIVGMAPGSTFVAGASVL